MLDWRLPSGENGTVADTIGEARRLVELTARKRKLEAELKTLEAAIKETDAGPQNLFEQDAIQNSTSTARDRLPTAQVEGLPDRQVVVPLGAHGARVRLASEDRRAVPDASVLVQRVGGVNAEELGKLLDVQPDDHVRGKGLMEGYIRAEEDAIEADEDHCGPSGTRRDDASVAQGRGGDAEENTSRARQGRRDEGPVGIGDRARPAVVEDGVPDLGAKNEEAR